MKVIFLDIDGVLNSDRIARMRRNHNILEMTFDQDAMENLSQIITETGSRIVISSTWRFHYKTENPLWLSLIDNLKQYNLDNHIIGTTEITNIASAKPRWKEINEWLFNKNDIESFVILDDEWDMGILNRNFVRCSGSVGISSSNCREAIEILNRVKE